LSGTDPKIDKAIDDALARAQFHVIPLNQAFKAKWDQAQKDGKAVAFADVQLVRLNLYEEPKFFQLRDAHCDPKPVQERLRNYFQKYLPAVQEITPEEWASMRSIARWVLPVLVGPSTAVTPAPGARSFAKMGGDDEKAMFSGSFCVAGV
jgi:hypothetical protein